MIKKAIGLNEEGILLADMTEDGAIPAEDKFKALGKTYKDTATLETEEGETVACECEEDDDPEDEIYIPGGTTRKYSTSDKKTWGAPDSFRPKDVFVKYTTKSGLQVTINRAKMYTRINWAIKKNGYGLLEHTLKVLKPKAAGVKKMQVVDTSITESEG